MAAIVTNHPPKHPVRLRLVGTRQRLGVVVGLVLLFASGPPAAAQQSQVRSITGVVTSGKTVIIAGTNLTGVTDLVVGDVTATNISANENGTVLTGTLPGELNPGTYSLVLTATAVANDTSCQTPKPGAAWVCVQGGGWVPPDHPMANNSVGNSTTMTFFVAVGSSGVTGPAGPAGTAGGTGAQGPAGPAGPAGTLSAMFASLYRTGEQFIILEPDQDVVFSGQTAMLNASLNFESLQPGGSVLQLGGSGSAAIYRVAWGVRAWGDLEECRLGIMVNGSAEQPLTFSGWDTFGGEAIVTMLDNASITLRNRGTYNCYMAPNNGAGSNSAFLTVMKIG